MTIRSHATLAFALAGTLVLGGCVGGTTYGTGVSQEQQTIEDLANILSFSKKRQAIDYKPRSDIVVPKEKQLVEPAQTASVEEDPSWPESPEERIARLRAEAEEAQATTASQNNFSRSQKNFRSVRPGEGQQQISAPIGQGVPNVTCSPERGDDLLRPCTAAEISNAVRAQRAEITSLGKTGYQRRYLTEPPLEYRTPADTAPQGDMGYSEAELKKIEAEEKRRRMEEMKNPRNN